jgi:hypothetical protein
MAPGSLWITPALPTLTSTELYFLSVCVGDGTQGLGHTKQPLALPLSYTSSPTEIFFWY